jgi:putative beta-lysine N-acetyltransferase
LVKIENSKTDIVEYIGKTSLQHGMNNNRVYLMKLDPDSNKKNVIDYIDKLCIENRYSKSFVKIRASDFPLFFPGGYRIEAYIPSFFRNGDDCIFACKYYDDERAVFIETKAGEAIASLLPGNKPHHGKDKADKFEIRKADLSDIASLAYFYGEQFPNYPFPLSSPEYLEKTMRANVDYSVITDNGEIIASASAEKDMTELNAEMTDFAVMPGYRGYGLAGKLMVELETHLKSGPVKTLYTIARLNSPAMNAVFKSSGYKYSGTLINNTNISTGIESMNVWYKHLL